MFVSLDIILQFTTGKDIFGFTPQGRRYAGPFGDELIAGGFIQRFSLIAFFLIPLFFKRKIPIKFEVYSIIFIFFLLFLGLTLSGNRMPFLIFLFSIFLIVLFQKQTRKFLIPFVIIFSILFIALFKTSITLRMNFGTFYNHITQMSQLVIQKDFNNEKSPPYMKEFTSFYDTWLMNKYIGGGIKNFRLYCHLRPNINTNSKFICNMHPHNYYLEILTETGLIGFSIITSIFLIIIYLTFIKKYFTNSKIKNNNLIIPFIFLFIAEIFPLKSTGSFFTTGNSTYLFLLIGILVGLVHRVNSIEKIFKHINFKNGRIYNFGFKDCCRIFW